MDDRGWEEQGAERGPFAELIDDPLGVLRRRWRPMLAIAVAGLLVTVAAIAFVPPRYAAHATILIASQRLSADFVHPMIEEDLLERVNALNAEVLSREKLAPIVEEFGLFPEVQEQAGMTQAVAMLRSKLTVETGTQLVQSRDARALVLSIGFTGSDPQQVANVANAVAGLFSEVSIRIRTQQARLTTEFMRRELEGAETALKEQKREIAEYQTQHRGELPSELESHLRRLERLQQQRNSLAIQITERETNLAITAASAGNPDPAAAHLRELETRLARELGVNKETHPNVISLRRQIEAARSQVRGGGSSALAGAGQREIALLREQLADTDRELKELDRAVAEIPSRQEQLSAMLEREKVLQENYLGFLRKVKEAELSQSLERAQQGDRVMVLDQASVPTSPVYPLWMLLLGGVVASLGLASAGAVLLELRDPVVASVAGLEAAAGVPVLGSVPHMV